MLFKNIEYVEDTSKRQNMIVWTDDLYLICKYYQNVCSLLGTCMRIKV